MKLFWTSLPLRTAWLVVLQYVLAIVASANDGFLSFVGGGIILLPTTVLLLLASFAALRRGYWLTAFFAFLGVLPGLLVLMFWLVVLTTLDAANR